MSHKCPLLLGIGLENTIREQLKAERAMQLGTFGTVSILFYVLTNNDSISLVQEHGIKNTSIINIPRPKMLKFTIPTYESDDEAGHEEVVLRLQGIVVDSNLPPISRDGQPYVNVHLI